MSNLPPLERLKEYLSDFSGWEEVPEKGDHYRYYSKFPEFVIIETEEDPRKVEAGENWVRAAINPKAYVRPLQLMYHGTVLKRIDCIMYDEMRGITPAPKPSGDTDEYYYYIIADTLDFLLLQVLTQRKKEDLIENGLPQTRFDEMPVVIFSSENEKNEFEQDMKANPVLVEKKHDLHNNGASEISEIDRRIVPYCRAVVERFKEWKSKRK